MALSAYTVATALRWARMLAATAAVVSLLLLATGKGATTTWTTALLVAAAALLSLLARRAAAAAAPPPDEPMPVIPPQVPGNGTKCFHGIRVVELATVVAAPSASRTLAEHGAEVIKIEEPRGDMWRKFFLEYEDSRGTEPGFSSCFESVNLSKYSVVVDLKRPEGVAKLKKILGDADVFITNVRPSGLKRLGLDYASLRAEFPTLVMAQLTAWGLDGPGSNLAGYDIGAFWTSTGMSELLHDEGNYSVYPIAAGDCVTGAALLSALNIALTHRARTGEGQGMFCLSHTLATTKPADTPEYAKYTSRQPCATSYRTRDLQRVVILGAGTASATLDKLVSGMGDARLTELDARRSEVADGEWVAALERCFAGYGLEELLERLESLGVPHCEQPSVPAMTAPTADPRTMCGDGPSGARCYADGAALGIADIPRLARNPLSLGCSPATARGAEPICRAPKLGAHTASFERQGWSPIKAEAMLPRVRNHHALSSSHTPGGLERASVVELSKGGVCASAACALLVDAGASVLKLEPGRDGDSWRTDNPQSFAQFNRGKSSKAVDLSKPAPILELLSDAAVFVTNFPPDELEALGLGHQALRARFPGLVYAIVTPWGVSNPRGPPGEKGAFFAYGGIASCMQKPEHQPPEIPEQLGETCVSFFLLSAITAGLFHRERTGEGQLCDVAMLRCATWMTNQTMIIGSRQPSGTDFMALTNMFSMQEFARQYFPVVTANCFRTSDGRWVQLLGVDLPRHLPWLAWVLGIQLSLYPRLVATLVGQVLPKRGPRLLKFPPIFRELNAQFTAAIAARSYDELTALFERHDVWYCPVNTPASALRFPQAMASGIFEDNPAGGGVCVRSPIRLAGGHGRTDKFEPAAAPALPPRP